MRGVLFASITFGLVPSSAASSPENVPLAAGQRTGRHLRAAMSPSARRCRGRSDGAQAASAPDALATWVAIASIKAGERQS
jgi:hypothetical protein